MELHLSTLSKPIIFAHRGASNFAPENTMVSFQKAKVMGAKAIELDTKLTNDVEVVVLHDDTLDRTTTGNGPLKNYSYAQLSKLDAGSHFDPTFSSQRIPLLSDVLKEFALEMLINIEVANYSNPLDSLPKTVAEIVDCNSDHSSIYYSSFNPIALYRLARLQPDIPRALLLHKGKWNFTYLRIAILLFSITSVHPHALDVSVERVEYAHLNNLMVFPYTINDRQEMLRVLKCNVDGFFTDDIPLAQQVCKE